MPGDLSLRPATADDCDAIAVITESRDGVPPGETRARCRTEVADDAVCLLVAVAEGGVVAFARAGRLSAAATETSDEGIPAGWYLLGVVVLDAWRRLGIGRELTRARLDWIVPRADAAYYVVNARNRASIDLHRELGFVEVARVSRAPGVVFEGGEGILARVSLMAPEPLRGQPLRGGPLPERERRSVS